ncbi:F0F1 ATP synthase subunit gamma [Aestuariibacter sp. A3R04]|uniref:F0F1 ATP synthase subunit gamma n=1 Tax=Aestuariibacter sp. A3R04 TaxID=2841571 RepID=UPI001C093104|nr:F0F1 ATP synthase subunit gamma [Aestuariibacter sp. A3R04]MBU3022312.1 F0F1 ATP synthase subunit gamma [Aestuariibacter sp. A3R04]
MTDSIASLRHKITSAQDLESVVRSMKTIASSSIGQYEKAVHSLDDYYQNVQLGLSACLSQSTQLEQAAVIVHRSQKDAPAIGVIVFGSDQGLVGQFNEVMVEFVVESLATLSGNKMLWAVGERVESRLIETDLKTEASFELPHSINTITGLVGEILIELEAKRDQGRIDQVFLFHHKPEANSISRPGSQQLLPLDAAWQQELVAIDWPSNNLVEVMPYQDQTRHAFVREYLFVSLFRACAESLASENACRLAAMQRAEKNIDEIQENLNQTFHRLRQSDIDEELSDVLSGFNASN